MLSFLSLLIFYFTCITFTSKEKMDDNIIKKNFGQFMLKLTNSLYQPGQNTVVSPFSLLTSLLMILSGTRTTTRSEMLNLLAEDKVGREINEDSLAELILKYFVQHFLTSTKHLTNKNFFYSELKCELKKEFVDTLVKTLSALCRQLDFTNQQAAIKMINQDVKEATKGMISTLLEELDPNTSLVLVNAIHFKGNWQYQFDKNLTFDAEFTRVNGEKIQVKMMSIKQRFPMNTFNEMNLSALLMPYDKESLSMLIILPDECTNVKNILDSLDQSKLEHILSRLICRAKVELKLPKFKIVSTHNLKSTLQTMGLNRIFGNHADLSGISDLPLVVSEIIQKAIVEVNEEGTEAAAATAACVMLRCALMEPEFIVNRAFIFFLMSETNIVFSGVVDNPSYP